MPDHDADSLTLEDPIASRRRGRFAAFVLRWTWLVLLAVGIATLAGFCASWAWWLELWVHFRVQYVYAALACGVVFLCVRSKRSVLAALLLALLNGVVLWPAFVAPANVPANVPATGPARKLLIVNLHSPNRSYQAVLDLVAAERPDLLLFVEATAAWSEALAPLHRDYPHRVTQSRSDNFGILLWSRLPMDGRLRYFGAAQVPSVEATVTVGAQQTHVLLTHPLPPVRRRHAAARDEQLRIVAHRARELGARTIVCGDFNTTPWSPIFAEVLELSGLRDSGRGFGIQPTWTTMFPWFLRIPIDQCLCSADLRVTQRRIGPDIGSDHLPLIVEVQ